MDTHSAVGILAALIVFAAYPIYILSVFRGTTKPDRVTWWILAVDNVLIASSSYAAGAHTTVWIPALYTLEFLFVAIISVRYGAGTYRLTWVQTICVLGAFIAMVLWYVFNQTELTLYISIAIDLLGIIPTIHKLYLQPASEDALAWGTATAGSLLNIFAIASWNVVDAIYPVYLLLTNGIIFSLILRAFHKKT